jgi:hypothetical protein
MAHVDGTRAKYAVPAGHEYGLIRVSGFDVPAGKTADGLRLRVLDREPVQLFAVTLETNRR